MRRRHSSCAAAAACAPALRLLWAAALGLAARPACADLHFDRFSHDPKGEASHLRLIGGAQVDFFSTEFIETCDPGPPDPVSLTAMAQGHYRGPPCRGDEIEIDDGDFPGQRRYAVCAPGPCTSNADCPASPLPSVSPSCNYHQNSTGFDFCELPCSVDDDCLGGPDGDYVRCKRHRCMPVTTIRNMSLPRSITQRFEFPQRRNDYAYGDLPMHTYLDDGQLDNPYAGRVEFGENTEVVITKDFVPDGDLTPLPHNRTQLCHYALRMTPPERALNTAVWSKFKQRIVYGFVTEFHFRVLHRNKLCIAADLPSPWCADAGGDGFAFVVQNENRKIVGTQVGGIGYAFPRSFVVEFDMSRDVEFGDPNDNHISVMIPWKQGQTNTANHDLSQVALTNDIPALSEGTHTVRIEYDTRSFKWDSLLRDFSADLNFEYIQEHTTGRAGLLTVWLDGRRVIVVPLDLIKVVAPDSTIMATESPPLQPNASAYDELGSSPGRAWVGFTSSTNYDHYQSVDITSWTFTEQFPCPLEDEGRHAYCDMAWTPNPPDPPLSIKTYTKTPAGYDETCFYDGSQLCYLEIQNAARQPIMFSAHTRFHLPHESLPCRDGTLQWNHMHPHFLGCTRQVYFTEATETLWITTMDGTRSIVIDDNQILQKTPAPFKRRNHNDADQHWKYCVMEHQYDPARLYFAECNCAYCVRQLDLLAYFAVFYQHMCSERFGLRCPCFEASESQHDSSAWTYQEPLKHMRVHICRGCAYTSQCSQMLKVAVCEDAYQTYYINNPLAPDILDNGFKDRVRDDGRVVNGQIRGDSCNCEPQLRPYTGSERAGMCKEDAETLLNTETVPTLNDCADLCANAARCSFFVFWENAPPWTGECSIFSVCIWDACSSKVNDEARQRCFKSATYRLAPLGSYTDVRSEVQRFNVFPKRTLQTNFVECKQCLFLYDEEYCYAQCGLPKFVPYLHYTAGQSCATCIFAGNRLHEMTDKQTQTVKDCVYQAIRESQDPWVVCNETAQEQSGATSDDLFNGVATHYLSECPGRAFDDHGSVCVPNLNARLDFPLQVLSRMAAMNDTVWNDQLECLNAMCQVVPKATCYQKLAIFHFLNDVNDESGVIIGTRYGIASPRLSGGYLIFKREFSGFGPAYQYALSSPLPFILENFTIEAWLKVGAVEAITDVAAGKFIDSNAQWYVDYIPEYGIDGLLATYWSSQLGTPSDIELDVTWTCDLGEPRWAGQVKIFWKEPARDYTISIRNNEEDEWVTIITVVDNTDVTTHHYYFFQARWVRVHMTKTSTTRSDLLTVDQWKEYYEPTNYPVYSIKEFHVLKDDEISRMKPTNSSQTWDRPVSLALDGDSDTYWATQPGTERSDYLVDFGSLINVNVLRINFRYKPELLAVVPSRLPCGTCPWVETTDVANMMQCNDFSFVDVTNLDSGGWGGCIQSGDEYKGGRAKCPPNFPLMCNDPCPTSAGSDWCCATDCDDYGGLRYCPPEEAMPAGLPIFERKGDQVEETMELTSTWQIHCLRVQMDRNGLAYGQQMSGIEEIEAFTEGDNIATRYFGSEVEYTLPGGQTNEIEASYALDNNPATSWLVTPQANGLVVLAVDLGDLKTLMSLEVIFATVDGVQYKSSKFALSIGNDVWTGMTQVDSVSGFMQMSRKVLLGLRRARYIKLTVEKVYSTNPGGKFGLQDLLVWAASDNLGTRNTTTGYATSAWITDPEDQFTDWTSGDFYPHAPSMALDNDFDTWWGAPLGVSNNPDEGAGQATYEILLADPQLLTLAAVRWRYPSSSVSASCAGDLFGKYLQVAAAIEIEDYITPLVFIGQRRCKKILITFGRPVHSYADEGIVGIREVELHNFNEDHALKQPIVDSDGQPGNLAVDTDITTRWATDSSSPKNLTVDLGEPKYAWGVRMLFPSNSIPMSFQLAIANSSDDTMAWAASDNFTVIEGFSTNYVADVYIITRFVARYIRIVFISTSYSAYAVRTLQVFGGPNYALGQTPLAVKSWNHSMYEAVDGNPDTFWLAEPMSTAARVRIDFGDEHFIAGGVKIMWKFAAENFKIVVSRDGLEWEKIHEEVGNVANITHIGNCFTARYVDVRMTKPSRLNGDGAYAIYGITIRFDTNLAHCKTVSATHMINSTQFLPFSANDGDPGTIWMPYQGATNASLIWDFEDDLLVSGFWLFWRFPPHIFYIEYQNPENLTQWIFVNAWGPPKPNERLPYEQEWQEGFPARRLRLQIVETARYDEGLLCALRETLVYYPSNENLVLQRPINVSSFYGEHVAEAINDGNERGTYWRAGTGQTSAWVEIALDGLPYPEGGPPPFHGVGRVTIMWRWAPGAFKVEFYFDTGWYTVHEGYGADYLLKTDFALNKPAMRVRLTVSAANVLDPKIGILQFKVFRVTSKLVPRMVAEDPPWNATTLEPLIDKVDPLSLDSDTETYWMTAHSEDFVTVVLDLHAVYNAVDVGVYYGFAPQVFVCYIATDPDGPWNQTRLTSGDVPGLFNLEVVGPSFPIRLLKIEIIKGYRDVEGILGTSIRDLAVYLFRNWARNTNATADSVWDYSPSQIVDGDMLSRWVSRYDTSHGKLIVDLGKPTNVAGMSWVFEWGCRFYRLYYRMNATQEWTSALYDNGDFTGLVEIPTTVHFKARFIMLEMKEPLVKIFHPDTPGLPKTDKYVFSVLDMKIFEHTGGGGVFGLQSLDGLQYTTLTYGLRQPGEWILASENEIFTRDLGEPPDFALDAWVHFAVTFETVDSQGTNRLTAVNIYRNGMPYGPEMRMMQPIDRLSLPNQTRLVFGVRSSAHDVPNASAWPPSESQLHPSLKENPYAEQWPDPEGNDPVKHGASHSPYFDGWLDRVTLIKNALSPEEVRGVYLDLELGCHCYDACPSGSNRHHPGVQVPCSGQGVCRRYSDGKPFQPGYCQCMPGFSGVNCERHCTHPPSLGCCEVDDDCPLGSRCNQNQKACLKRR